MNLEEIKEIIKREGGKIVIVENNKPLLIIMSFEEWRQGRNRQEQAPPMRMSHNPSPKQMPATPLAEERTEGLTIDDLPI